MEQELLKQHIDTEIHETIKEDFSMFVEKTFKQKDFVLLVVYLNEDISSFEVEQELNNLGWAREENRVRTLLNRLTNSNKFIEITSKDGRYNNYSITQKGRAYINSIINSFLETSHEYQEYLINKREEKLNSIEIKDFVRTIIGAIITANIKPRIDGKLIINLEELSIYSPEAVDLIYSDFPGAEQVIYDHFRQENDEVQKDNIFFKNAHTSVYQDIHNIDREYQGLVFTKGLVTSKKENIVLEIEYYYYRCKNQSCEYNEDLIKSKKKLNTKNFKCLRCGSVVELDSQDKVNYYESKLSNIDSGVSIPLVFRGRKTRLFSQVGLGDEIEVIGHFENKIVEVKQGETEKEIKCLVVNNFKLSDNIKELNEEEVKVCEEIIETKNISNYLMKPFENYIEQEWIKELFLLQQLTKHKEDTFDNPISIAFMGEPGVGKNELIKIAEKYFPKTTSMTGANVTDAGFKGTVNRDTGIKEIGEAKKCQNGTIFFNEFDKFIKSNPNGKKAASQLLNESITEQQIRLNKAGIKIRYDNLDLRHNIVFNPLEDSIIDSEKPAHYFIAQLIDKSLLSRMIPLYVRRDDKRSIKVFDIMLNKKKTHNKIDEKLYQLIIRYLRSFDVTISDDGQEKLKEVYLRIIKTDQNNLVSAERIGQVLIQLSKAHARYRASSQATKEDVKRALEIYFNALKSVDIDLDNIRLLFMEQDIPQIKSKLDIKNYFKVELENKEEIKLSEYIDLFNEEVLLSAIEDLKNESYCYEPRKDLIKRLS